MASLQAEVGGLFALGVLLLLPGLVAVRGSWPLVPLLSTSFWILSAWWLDLLSGSRRRFLIGSLACLALLAALRSLRARRRALPGWPTLLVLAGALARVAPYAAWPVGPGIDMSLHSVSTLLFVGRDGIPRTYEPLLPIPSFGAYTPGLHSFAADVSLLASLPAHRSTFLVSLAAYGLLQLALFELMRRFFDARVAAVASLAALALARSPQSFFGWGGNPLVLALALLTGAAALLAGGRSRGAAAAAGLLLAATVVAHTVIALAALALLPLALHSWRSAAQSERRTFAGRLMLAGLVALVAAAPFLLRLDYTLSTSERAWMGDLLRVQYGADGTRASAVGPFALYPLTVIRSAIGMLGAPFLWPALVGGALALRRRSPALPAVAACVALLFLVAGTAPVGGLGPLAVAPEGPLALAAIVLSAGLAILLEALLSRRGWVVVLSLIVVSATALERFHRHYLSAAREVMVSSDDLEAMAWIRGHTRPLDLICNEYGTPGLWVGALAARAISAPRLPPFYLDEFRQGHSGRRCDHRYVSKRSLATLPAAPEGHQRLPAFENVTVMVLTSFDSANRNLGTPKP